MLAFGLDNNGNGVREGNQSVGVLTDCDHEDADSTPIAIGLGGRPRGGQV